MPAVQAIGLPRCVQRDLSDSDDEELALELDDLDLDPGTLPPLPTCSEREKEARRQYFHDLLRLQAGLVKLQDRVVHTGHKAVILFKGRDAAGKGGVVKRIAQRLNPRVCRVAALPAPNERERTRWYLISDAEQSARFPRRIHDPLKQWKLSPMDLESRRRWEEYTRAKEVMLERTHIPEAHWSVVQGVDKTRARLHCIHGLLQQTLYVGADRPTIEPPERECHHDYVRRPVPPEIIVPEIF